MANPESTIRPAGRSRLRDLDMCYRIVSGWCAFGAPAERLGLDFYQAISVR